MKKSALSKVTQATHLPQHQISLAPIRKPENPRVNQVGIQYLSEDIRGQIFPKIKEKSLTQFDEKKIRLSQQYLNNFGLLNKKTNITTPIAFDLPKTQGSNLNEHFIRLALRDSDPYYSYARELASCNLPPKPSKWEFKSGWYKYDSSGSAVKVDYPEEDILVFDVETMYKLSPFAVMATCASPTAWYGWVSPFLVDKIATDAEFLIPLNTMRSKKLIIGHNVSYDRARVAEEYNIAKSKAFYLDTLSLHAAVSGICSRQRPVWTKYNVNSKIEGKLKKAVPKLLHSEFSDFFVNGQFSEVFDEKFIDKFDIEAVPGDNPWTSVTSTNSLADTYNLYCGGELDKSVRDIMSSTNKQEIVDEFQTLMTYCAGDVDATHKVFQQVFPRFVRTCPHPVSFAALRHINTIFLPTTKNTWQSYINNAESLYQNNRVEIEEKLAQMAKQLVEKHKEDSSLENDPWYGQLNWTICPVRMTKKGVPYKRQKMPGFPEWYRSLCDTNGVIKLTIRTRIVPILLQLKWEGLPLVWTETKGWCFRVDANKFTLINDLTKKNYLRIDDFTQDPNFETLTADYKYIYFKVPHPNGPSNRVTNMTSKSFLKHYEKGILTSEFEIAQRVLELNASASYWISSRERIMNQFVVYDSDKANFQLPMLSNHSNDPTGIIIPQILPMGTITRRAVEKTWLTASNVKPNRIGSELKTKIQAPSGYCFVGADVDSEELWIASLISDSVFQIHGGSAIGWMTLEGNKLEKTDLHSKTAEILGISRNEAKIFNYSRIYGAGLKHTSTLLKQFNPVLTDAEVTDTCNNLFNSTKGKTHKLSAKEKSFFSKHNIFLNKIWFGGSESVLFNRLESLAETDMPKTPVLKAGITEALKKQNLKANSFLPSRINWAIQSSGVDYLHLLITSMEYLIEHYGIDARLCITVHDEIRYLVRERDKYKAALLLQISNIWTRGLFCEQLGIQDVPQSCAFFSQVDIDSILRKEVNTNCETPSNKGVNIAEGETLDIVELLKTIGGLDWLENGKIDLHVDEQKVKNTVEILKSFASGDVAVGNSSGNGLSSEQEIKFIEMQIEQSPVKARKIIRNLTTLGSNKIFQKPMRK